MAVNTCASLWNGHGGGGRLGSQWIDEISHRIGGHSDSIGNKYLWNVGIMSWHLISLPEIVQDVQEILRMAGQKKHGHVR